MLSIHTAICPECMRNYVGSKDRPNGWLLHDRRKQNAPKMWVCDPCEKVIGDANLSLAGYKRTQRGAWLR